MSLSVHVTNPPGPIAPGSTVRGHVQLLAKSEENIASIDISFTGRCKVKIRKHDHYTTMLEVPRHVRQSERLTRETRSYRSRGYYFSETLTLLNQGPGYTYKAGTYIWPFEFLIPAQAKPFATAAAGENASAGTSLRPRRQLSAVGIMQKANPEDVEADFFPAESPWRGSNDLRPHPLPDTFNFEYSRWPTDFDCRVQYVLHATLRRPPGSSIFSGKSLEASEDIDVKSPAASNALSLLSRMQTRNFEATVSSLRLHPSKTADSKLSLMDKTRSVLRPTSVPKYNFSITMQSPQFLQFGKPVVLRISMQAKEDSEQEYGPPPLVRLKGCVLQLLAETMVRDNGQAAISQSPGSRDQILQIEKQGLDMEMEVGSAAQKPQAVDIGTLLDIRLVSADGQQPALPPNFSTYNISRSYLMAIRLKFVCVGEVITVPEVLVGVGIQPEFRRRRASISNDLPPPPTFEEAQRDEKRGPIPPPPAVPADEEEQLPAYEPRSPVEPPYEPTSPAFDTEHFEPVPASPTYDDDMMRPAHRLLSQLASMPMAPAYEPTSPVYEPSGSAESQPISPTYEPPQHTNGATSRA